MKTIMTGAGMQAATPLGPPSEVSDPQAIKRWAAEDFAISIGVLRECPYHGQPFQVGQKTLSMKRLAAGVIDPLDPAVQVFNGNTRELLAAVERVTREYGERCVFCAASDHETEFD
jgi:hypothetical protein